MFKFRYYVQIQIVQIQNQLIQQSNIFVFLIIKNSNLQQTNLLYINIKKVSKPDIEIKRLKIFIRMFKKRIISNKNNNSAGNSTINLQQEIQQIQNLSINNEGRQGLHVKKQTKDESNENINYLKPTNKMKTQQQVADEQQQERFLQKMQKDKKLNDLFQKIQHSQQNNQTNKNNQTHQNDNNSVINKYIKRQNNTLPSNKPIEQSLKRPSFSPINFSTTQTKTQFPSTVKSQLLKNFPNLDQQNIQTFKQQQINSKQMQTIFKQIFQHNKKQKQQQTNKYKRNHQQQIIQQNENDMVQTHHKVIKRTNQLIIQDDDRYGEDIPTQTEYQMKQQKQSPYSNSSLNVVVDYQGNGLSPQLSQIDQEDDQFSKNLYQDDFQDQLIRKTLTKSNYTKLLQTSNLKQTKKNQHKQKLLNRILKVSWFDIEKKIFNDMTTRLNKKNELNKQIKYLSQRVSERQAEFQRKKGLLQQLHKQQKKLKKVIYFLCYFGDQIGIHQSQSLQQFFNDLTTNIITKIQKLSDRVNIEDFMQKQADRQKLRQKYMNGRKKIKYNTNVDQQGEVVVEEEIQQQDDDDQEDDGQCYMDDD